MIIEATGKTIEEAIESGLKELGKDISEVETEVLVQPSSGILGFGKKEAKVRLTVIEKQVEEVPVEAIQVEEVPVEAIQVEEVSVEVKPVELDGEETRNDAEEIAADAKEFLNTILEKMGISAVIEKMIKADRITLHIHGEDLGVLIGKHGQTLDALQYIINLKANKGKENRFFIMLDVENYRARREETLKNLAHRLASRVKRNRNKVVLEPMNGFERKIIHVALQDTEHVRTESEGQDPYRHVVIYYQ